MTDRSDTPRTDALLLIINEWRVYADDGPLIDHARQLERELAAAQTEIRRCHTRLEIDHVWWGDGTERIDVPYEERQTIPDGIACRDETIKLQDASIERLQAELAAERKVTARLMNESGIQPCCQEWDTCQKRCVPLAENWRMAAKRTEAALADEKAMRAKNIWCCDQAEKRCKELEAALAQTEQVTIERCAKVCDPLGISAQEYCSIKNHSVRRDFDRDMALMKNLAKAIRALAQPAQGATESAAGQKADTVRDCMDKTMALAKKQLNHYKECAPSADPLYNALLNDGIIVEKSADPLAQSLEVERLKDELAALNLAYDSAMRVGTKRAIEAQSQQEPVAWRCRGRASIAHEWDSWSVKGYKPQGPESERFQIEPLYAAPQPAQDGMVMVPREPTEVMIEEWNYACRDQPGCAFWEPSYLAMISAAPDAKPTDGGKKP